MTAITRPIRRELPGTFDRREFIVELHPWGLSFRAKRTRKSFPILWVQVWNRAMEISAARERAEKIARRKARKEGHI